MDTWLTVKLKALMDTSKLREPSPTGYEALDRCAPVDTCTMSNGQRKSFSNLRTDYLLRSVACSLGALCHSHKRKYVLHCRRIAIRGKYLYDFTEWEGIRVVPHLKQITYHIIFIIVT